MMVLVLEKQNARLAGVVPQQAARQRVRQVIGLGRPIVRKRCVAI